jgi:vitamin B12 transporter
MFDWLLLVALAGVAAPTPQQASTPPFQEEVVVTGVLVRESRSDLPASATVIEADEIRERQASQVLDVLRTVPGLDVVQSGSPGKVVSLFARGAESNQSLVLWNGLPLNDPYFGGFDWAYMPTDGVDRIEVIRGPFSSLYGSDAMGGVVQVLSGEIEGGSARLEGGSDSYGRAAVALGEDLDGFRFDVAGHARQGDGAADNDFFDGEDLMARLEWQASESSTLGLLARVSRAEIGIPVASGVATPSRRQESDALQFALPYVLELEDWKVEATLSRTEGEFVFTDPEAFFSLSATDSERVRGRGVVTYRPADDWWVASGIEWQEDEVTSESNFGSDLDAESRPDWAFFAQGRKRIGRVGIDFGLRHDEDEFFGGQLSPRGGVVVDLSQQVQLFGSYGRGFRAPSLGELFFPFFGNTDLEPEESESIEAGMRWAGRQVWASLVYFDTDFDNLIEGDPVTFTAINAGRAETSGWEIELGYAQGILEARTNITLLDALSLETRDPLLRRAEEKANLLLAVRPEDLVLQLVARYVGERDDLDPVTFARTVNKDYLVTDFALTWQASERLAPYGRIGNLSDEQYQEVLGFPAPGRTWALGLEVRWP